MKPRLRPAGLLWIFLLIGAALPLAAQNRAAGQSKHGYCASCHGVEGRSAKPHYPILAGQSERYLLAQLKDFKQGRRREPNMDAVVPQLSAQDMRDLAAFFASVKPARGRFEPDPEKFARGKLKAAQFGCARCHARNSDFRLKPAPRIAGQHRDYLAKQLRDFRDGRRADNDNPMRRITESLSDADIDNLGEYFAGIR